MICNYCVYFEALPKRWPIEQLPAAWFLRTRIFRWITPWRRLNCSVTDKYKPKYTNPLKQTIHHSKYLKMKSKHLVAHFYLRVHELFSSQHSLFHFSHEQQMNVKWHQTKSMHSFYRPNKFCDVRTIKNGKVI